MSDEYYHGTFHVARLPVYVGQWVVGKALFIKMENRPNIIHRAFMRLLLGIVWRDAPRTIAPAADTPPKEA